jgi:hypothetical protein
MEFKLKIHPIYPIYIYIYIESSEMGLNEFKMKSSYPNKKNQLMKVGAKMV